MTAADETGPFFHGTRAELRPGDLLVPGRPSNYRPEVVMRHVYCTALPEGAGLAAEVAVLLVEIAGGDASTVAPHVYEVEPLGALEDDPNVTDQKFPGNPTRSYRSTEPLRVLREVDDWTPLTPQSRALWRTRLLRMRDDPAAVIRN